jgi:hypothetical protein
MQRTAFSHEEHETPAPLIEIFSSEAYSNNQRGGKDRDNYGFNVMEELADDEEEEEEECQKGFEWSEAKEKCEGNEIFAKEKFLRAGIFCKRTNFAYRDFW